MRDSRRASLKRLRVEAKSVEQDDKQGPCHHKECSLSPRARRAAELEQDLKVLRDENAWLRAELAEQDRVTSKESDAMVHMARIAMLLKSENRASYLAYLTSIELFTPDVFHRLMTFLQSMSNEPLPEGPGIRLITPLCLPAAMIFDDAASPSAGLHALDGCAEDCLRESPRSFHGR